MGEGHRKRRLSRTLQTASLIVILASPRSTHADAGVPMLAVVWPASWVLFIPVVAIEAWLAHRIVGLSIKRSVLASAVANAVSTLVGIPLVWALLAAVEIVATGGGRAFGIDSFWHRVFAVTVQAAWLIPYESDLHWMVPAAAMVLLVPFFFASVFVERAVLSRFCTSPDLARRWSWMSNGATYSVMLIGLVVTLTFELVGGS